MNFTHINKSHLLPKHHSDHRLQQATIQCFDFQVARKKIKPKGMTCLAQQAEAQMVVLVIHSCLRAIDFGSGCTPYLHSEKHNHQSQINTDTRKIFYTQQKDNSYLLKEVWMIHKYTVNSTFVAVEEANSLNCATNFYLPKQSCC